MPVKLIKTNTLVTKYICDKCGIGDCVYSTPVNASLLNMNEAPSVAKYLDSPYTHVCNNCGEKHILDKIYGNMELREINPISEKVVVKLLETTTKEVEAELKVFELLNSNNRNIVNLDNGIMNVHFQLMNIFNNYPRNCNSSINNPMLPFPMIESISDLNAITEVMKGEDYISCMLKNKVITKICDHSLLNGEVDSYEETRVSVCDILNNVLPIESVQVNKFELELKIMNIFILVNFINSKRSEDEERLSYGFKFEATNKYFPTKRYCIEINKNSYLFKIVNFDRVSSFSKFVNLEKNEYNSKIEFYTIPKDILESINEKMLSLIKEASIIEPILSKMGSSHKNASSLIFLKMSTIVEKIFKLIKEKNNETTDSNIYNSLKKLTIFASNYFRLNYDYRIENIILEDYRSLDSFGFRVDEENKLQFYGRLSSYVYLNDLLGKYDTYFNISDVGDKLDLSFNINESHKTTFDVDLYNFFLLKNISLILNNVYINMSQ